MCVEALYRGTRDKVGDLVAKPDGHGRFAGRERPLRSADESEKGRENATHAESSDIVRARSAQTGQQRNW